MAALRKIIGRNLTSSNTARICSLMPPTLFLSCRGIASKLFVGGLSYYTTDEGLSEAFSKHGQVVEARVIMDRVSDRSKGFGFVTFASQDEAEKALAEMNGNNLNGRVIYVEYAKPQTNFSGEMPIARGPPEPIAES
ncbi:hypothetical protein LWI29_004867 [Acer saccharum]|uniref:RRM domain-containing protein n=1 Tax=Acer saccharum TaxID=4024 RepID=A0AA39RXN3_ACESA|nr:hypothetical protein LWI29_004867 [Acer saccharum]KAK1563062.1 hypothetical protein Q3G72_021664 [Acer saccharum]